MPIWLAKPHFSYRISTETDTLHLPFFQEEIICEEEQGCERGTREETNTTH